PLVHFLDLFVDHFRDVLSKSTSTITVHDKLFHLRQADMSINDYTVHFRTLAASSGWNETATTYQISTIQGKPLGKGLVRHRTPDINLSIRCFHVKRLSLLVLEEANVDIILGCPWLAQHHPDIHWTPRMILRWRCQEEYMKNLPDSGPISSTISLCSTTVESPNSQSIFQIPKEYRAFQDVFGKDHLPPHQPWNCAIDLLPGAKLPKGHVYPLSTPEQAAMEEYIQEALQQG
ncbi:hypothetical protein M9458_038583, partial [Cirrhinus mrigala]